MIKSNTLSNDKITIQVSDFGAELSSIKENETGKEYLWNADPTIWPRHAPVLFPFVGINSNKQYKYNNQVYNIGQHGFARDMEFIIEHDVEHRITHSLSSNDITKEKYPFNFKLEITHTIIERKIIVDWKVINTSDRDTMYFGIGAHPAFMCPLDNHSKQTECKVKFDVDGPLTYFLVGEGGCVSLEEHSLELTNRMYKITGDMFDKDALIFDNNQFNQVSLVDADDNVYVTVTSNGFPSYGIWSIPNAPYVCLEPWYGRSDNEGFNGSLEEKYLINKLQPKGIFNASYSIEI